MAIFKVIKAANLQEDKLWQGELEYKGESLEYRYYDGWDGQEVHILTESGWERDHELADVLYACCQEWGNPEEFGQAGEICEIDDDIVEDYI